MLVYVLAALAVALVILIILHHRRGTTLTETSEQLERTRRDFEEATRELRALQDRFRSVTDLDGERERVAAALTKEKTELEVLARDTATLRAEFARLDEEATLQSFGFYKPIYDFHDSKKYEDRLEQNRETQKLMIKNGRAAIAHQEWTVNGSKAEGKKSTTRLLKLMLRAFNGESDACISKVRYNNIHVMEARIEKAREAINTMTEVQQCEITREYLSLKLDELHLVHEYEEQLQEEKEEQRRIREQIREEEQAQRELERARLDAEKEEGRYEKALARATEEVAKAQGAKQEALQAEIAELQARLAEAHARKERAISQAQLTKSGHVYVISNIGSFGEHVYKIGMTRRLDPRERIKELGDASVPFDFDIHAVIYSEDAPRLENTLHRRFHQRRMNRVNERKEFFRVTIDEIATAVAEQRSDIEITKAARAEQYRKTQALLDEERTAGASIPIHAPAAPRTCQV